MEKRAYRCLCVHGGGEGWGVNGGFCPYPPVRIDIMTPRHLILCFLLQVSPRLKNKWKFKKVSHLIIDMDDGTVRHE